jgi:hypothetical protein
MSVTLTNEQFQALLNAVTNGNQSQPNANISNVNVSNNAINTNVLSLDDFLENMKFISVRKLLSMNIVDFIVNTIKHNIDSLEEEEYPFICTNLTKKIFYFRNGNKWEKGTGFIKQVHNRIVKQAYKDLINNFTQCYEDEDDEEMNEKKYMQSVDGEKQEILMNLCYADKISYETINEKVLGKISKIIKTDIKPK